MRKYIHEIIRLFSRNTYSEQLTDDVESWLTDNTYLEEKDKALMEVWSEAGKMSNPAGLDKSELRFRLANRMEVKLKPDFRTYVWKAAAVVLLLVSLGTTALLWRKQVYTASIIEQYVPQANMQRLTLPDGTEVLMNAESTLLYPSEFKGETRSVYLIGEANFKVRPDKEHPFVVKTRDFQVTALGTEFNVSAYAEEDMVNTTLLSGRVQVDFNNMHSRLILEPSMQFAYNRKTGTHTTLKADVVDVTAWQRGEIVFRERQLDDILTTLSKRYPFSFVYSLYDLGERTYSFRFSAHTTIEEAMDIITRVSGDLTYKIENNKCYIIKKR